MAGAGSGNVGLGNGNRNFAVSSAVGNDNRGLFVGSGNVGNGVSFAHASFSVS